MVFIYYYAIDCLKKSENFESFEDAWKSNQEKEHGKCDFAILDDDDGDLHLFGKHFVQTSWYGQNEEETALTPKHVEQCIKLLKIYNIP